MNVEIPLKFPLFSSLSSYCLHRSTSNQTTKNILYALSKSVFITNSLAPSCTISATDHGAKEHHNAILKIWLIR
jgi:hypothetical protein